MKKREVKPFIDVEKKDTIYKLSFVTGISVMSICEDLCNHAFKKGIGNELSRYFIRDIQIDGHLFKGKEHAPKFEPKSKRLERVSMSLDKDSHSYAYDISCAMGCSVARVVAYSIEKSMNDFEYMDHYVEQFLVNKLDEERSSHILTVMKDLNQWNLEEEYSLTSLLFHIADNYRRFEDGIDGVLKDVYT